MGTKQEGGEWLGHRTSAAPRAPEPNLNLLGAGSQLGKGVLGALPHRKGREGSTGETLPALLTLLLETLLSNPPAPSTWRDPIKSQLDLMEACQPSLPQTSSWAPTPTGTIPAKTLETPCHSLMLQLTWARLSPSVTLPHHTTPCLGSGLHL